MYPFLSEFPGPDAISFSLPTLPLPAAPSSPAKEDKKSEVIIALFKEKTITGRGEPSLVLRYTPWTETELRALAKELPNPSQDPVGFAGTSLVVQWVRLCAPNAGGPGSIPGRGTRSCMHAATKSPHAATKSLHAATKKAACCN